MPWFLVALLSPIAWGASNVLDNYLTNTLFKNTWTLTAYSILFNSVFIPLALLIERPGLPPAWLIPFLLLIGVIETLYPYPYYKALQDDDTSIVASLFTLGKAPVPVLAFFFVGETLTWQHYLGFFIILLGSTALTINGSKGTLRLNRSFGYMLISALLLSVEAVIYKYVFEHVSWSTGFIWATLTTLPMIGCLFFFPKIRRDLLEKRRVFKKHLGLFAGQELLNFIGMSSYTYALVLAPVTLVTGIGALQPLFILLAAVLFQRFLPRGFHERTDPRNLFKKFLLFGIMVIGAILVMA